MFIFALSDGTKIKVQQRSDWKRCIDEDFKVGDFFDAEIAWTLINCVPPLNFSSMYFQCGEPASHIKGKATYLTLKKVHWEPEIWQFLGNCYDGETKEPECKEF